MIWRLFLFWLWYRWCGDREVSSPSGRTTGWDPLAETAGTQNYFVEDDPTLPPPSVAVRQMLRLARRFAPQEGTESGTSSAAIADSIPDEIYTLW